MRSGPDDRGPVGRRDSSPNHATASSPRVSVRLECRRRNATATGVDTRRQRAGDGHRRDRGATGRTPRRLRGAVVAIIVRVAVTGTARTAVVGTARVVARPVLEPGGHVHRDHRDRRSGRVATRGGVVDVTVPGGAVAAPVWRYDRLAGCLYPVRMYAIMASAGWKPRLGCWPTRGISIPPGRAAPGLIVDSK